MADTLAKDKPLTLFGGNEGWHSDDWTASDDSVRGGKSESFLECKEHHARFHGTLDIKTLGGAGFASQRTTGEDREWDLSDYVGINIDIKSGDKRRYTFILKDELLPPDATTGREQSTISWECDFELPPQTTPGETHDRAVFIPWDSLNPTYRGKLKKDADPLDTKSIKRMSIMMRSFFGAQEGDFSLSIRQISALSKVPKGSALASKTTSVTSPAQPTEVNHEKLERGPDPNAERSSESFGAGGSSGSIKPTQTIRQIIIVLAGAAALGWLFYRTAKTL